MQMHTTKDDGIRAWACVSVLWGYDELFTHEHNSMSYTLHNYGPMVYRYAVIRDSR